MSNWSCGNDYNSFTFFKDTAPNRTIELGWSVSYKFSGNIDFNRNICAGQELSVAKCVLQIKEKKGIIMYVITEVVIFKTETCQ